MSRSPFDRWDLGEPNPEGAKHPLLPGFRFDGTDFAIRYDRRWEFIATWPFVMASGWAEPTVARKEMADRLVTKSKPTQRRIRAAALKEATGYAEQFVRYPASLEHTHLTRAFDSTRCVTHSLFATLDGMLTKDFDYSALEAALLIEGFHRWNGYYAESIEEIEQSEGVKLPRNLRGRLVREFCTYPLKMDIRDSYIQNERIGAAMLGTQSKSV